MAGGKRPRRMTTLNDSHLDSYPFLVKKPNLSDSMVLCTLCSSTFSIGNGGVTKIEQHIKTSKHLNATCAGGSQLIYNKLVSNAEKYELAAKVGTLAFHSLKHEQSFGSMDCTSKLVKLMFNSEFSSARSKTEGIAVHVLAPAEYNSVYNDLEKAKFVSVSLDCFNRRSMKLWPVLVRYFLPGAGVCVKYLQTHELINETTLTLCEKLYETLNDRGIVHKISSMCADNIDANFEGESNLFNQLNNELGRDILGIGCAAHIVNNYIESACDTLSFDVEGIIYKIYKFFSSYAVRTENLKEFCEVVDEEYERMSSSVGTTWLTLGPAIEHLLKVYDGVKEYFLYEASSNCPVVLESFFSSRINEVYLWFLHCQSGTIRSAIFQIEGQTVSGMEALVVLNHLLSSLQTRKSQKYIGIHAKAILKKIIDELKIEEDVWDEVEIEVSVGGKLIKRQVHRTEKDFYDKVDVFYGRAIEYLQDSKKSFESMDCLTWVLLNKEPNFEEVERSIEFVKTQSCFGGLNFDYEQIFDEFMQISAFANKSRIASWNDKRSNEYRKPDRRWVDIFEKMKEESFSVANISLIVEFAFSLPGTSAPVKRAFSLLGNYHSEEQACTSLGMIEAALCIKMNVDVNCVEYYEWLKYQDELLRKIHSSTKNYDCSAQFEISRLNSDRKCRFCSKTPTGVTPAFFSPKELT